MPFAGTSWEPETASKNKGEYILGKAPKEDGTSIMLDAFVEAVITRKQPKDIVEEAYYASALSLLGHQAIEQEQILQANQRYSVVVRTELAVVRNPEKADFTVAYDSGSDTAIRTAKVFDCTAVYDQLGIFSNI